MTYKTINRELIRHFVRSNNVVILAKDSNLLNVAQRGYLSEVRGPFEEKQEVSEEQKPFTLNIPEDEMSEGFENIFLIEYNFHPYKSRICKADLCSYLEMPPRELIRKREVRKVAENKTGLIMAYGEHVLNKLTIRYDLLRVLGKNKHRFLTDGCLGEIVSYEKELYNGSTNIVFPNISLRLLGDEEVAKRILKISEIKGIRRYLPLEFANNGGIKQSHKKGLTYNLNLKGKSIDELVNSKNVIF